MKIKEVSVEYGRTINLGNYCTKRLSLTVTADVQDLKEWESLYSDIKKRIDKKAKKLLKDAEY